jgi:ABC-type dipeptide/oligopeptide/nickel transport system ATPase component
MILNHLALNPIAKWVTRSRTCCASMQSAATIRRRRSGAGAGQVARPRERYHAYPFRLSGGVCQRVVIALAQL